MGRPRALDAGLTGAVLLSGYRPNPGICELPDGEIICEPPDGEGICELPDGEGVCELPDGEGVCELPEGEIICDPPDGEIICEPPANADEAASVSSMVITILIAASPQLTTIKCATS